ncbi:MAG TPA: hypothetical protein VFB71_12265 [Ramlibacter sp.]|nr:hypothetical protein [Ramlibacter sp.]
MGPADALPWLALVEAATGPNGRPPFCCDVQLDGEPMPTERLVVAGWLRPRQVATEEGQPELEAQPNPAIAVLTDQAWLALWEARHPLPF